MSSAGPACWPMVHESRPINPVTRYAAMSATDVAKDIVRLANTANMSKHVIDLLKKKLALLTEELVTLRSAVSRLQAENACLMAQVHRTQPAAGGLDDDTLKVLRFFFDTGRELSIPQVAKQFGFPTSAAQFHFEELMRRRFIRRSRARVGDHAVFFELLPAGREFQITNRA